MLTLGLKVFSIMRNLVTKRREIMSVTMQLSNVLMREAIANVKMVIYIMVKQTIVSNFLLLSIQFTRINHSQEVKLSAVTLFLLILFQELENNAGASHGKNFLHSILLRKETLKLNHIAQVDLQSTMVPIRMEPQFLILMEWLNKENTS